MKRSFAVPVLILMTSAAFAQAVGAAPNRPVQVELVVEGRGRVLLDLYPSKAPKTVAQIVRLCKSGFYNGILVHRVEPGFVVQAGDPKTKTLKPNELATMDDQQKARLGIGAGGSGSRVPFERNSLTHVPGTIAMALSAPRSDTADSQWFINLASNHQLDGDYCVFGKVVKGMEVVEKIRVGDRIRSMSVVQPRAGAKQHTRRPKDKQASP